MSCSMDFILVFFSWFAFKFVTQVNEVLLEVIFNLRMFKRIIDRRFQNLLRKCGLNLKKIGRASCSMDFSYDLKISES